MPRNLSHDGWSLDPRPIRFDGARTTIGYRLDGSVPRELVPRLERVDAPGDVAALAATGARRLAASAGDVGDGGELGEGSEEGDVPLAHDEAIGAWSTWGRWAAASVLGLAEVVRARGDVQPLREAALHRGTGGVACRADVAASAAVPWRLITFLTSHAGGEGSLVVHDHRPPAADALRARPLDPAAFGVVGTRQIAAVRSRTVLIRSDLAHQLLPAANPSAFITMLVLVGDDGRTAISLG
jgi:hypothetical protein